jgi:hypothetical protein
MPNDIAIDAENSEKANQTELNLSKEAQEVNLFLKKEFHYLGALTSEQSFHRSFWLKFLVAR